MNIEEMERSMKIAYQKAFDTNDKAVLRLRRKSYSNLHKVLAGSYFYAGNYGGFIKNSLKSLFFEPGNLVYFAEFPLRFWKRRTVKGQ